MGNALSTIPMVTSSAATSTALRAITPELQAARQLFASSSSLSAATSSSAATLTRMFSSISSSNVATTTATPLLLQARRSYSDFLINDKSVRVALPEFLMTEDYSSSSVASTTAAASLHSVLLSLFDKIRSKAHELSGLLVAVAQFLSKNPRLVLAGSVSLVTAAGVAYLVISKQQRESSSTTVSDDTLFGSTTNLTIGDQQQQQQHFAELEKELMMSSTKNQNQQNHRDTEKMNYHISLCCPITGELFVDPVIVISTGHTYEKSAITFWISSQEESGRPAVCPMTRTEIRMEHLVPNLAVAKAVQEYSSK